jgi:hypothetical protein
MDYVAKDRDCWRDFLKIVNEFRRNMPKEVDVSRL